MKLLRLEESVSAEFLTDGIDFKEAIEEARSGNPKKFVVKIQAIHAKTTKNKIEYTSERLRGNPEFTVDGVIRPTGQYSWTRPYPKPILTHHDPHSDPLGRIVDAKFVEKTLPSGLPGIEVSAEIGNPEAIEKIRDGRFLTVSIGAETDSLFCNICGSNKLSDDSDCRHWKGQVYDGVECRYVVGNIWFSELSFVNKPADDDARVVSFGGTSSKAKESEDEIYIIDENSKSIILLTEHENSEGEESDTLENKDKDLDTTNLENLDKDNETQENVSENPEPQSSENEETENKDNDSSEENEESVDKKDEALESILSALKAAGLINEESNEASEQEEENPLQEEVNRLRQENKELIDKNTELQKKIRESLIEKIVGLKIKMGRIDESKIEEEKDILMSRSEDSLNDSLADLMRENVENKETTREKQLVNSPGLANNSENNVIESEDNSASETRKRTLSAEDIFSNLFKGKKEL